VEDGMACSIKQREISKYRKRMLIKAINFHKHTKKKKGPHVVYHMLNLKAWGVVSISKIGDTLSETNEYLNSNIKTSTISY
jgi:hypothetical protein